MAKKLDLSTLSPERAAKVLRHRMYFEKRAGRPPVKMARLVKALKPCLPERDPAFRLQQRDSFKEADALAQSFGLTYLSISGTAKLADIIAHVRGEKEK